MAIRVSSWLGQKATESGVVSKEMVFTHLPVDTSHNLRVLSLDPNKVITIHRILINAQKHSHLMQAIVPMVPHQYISP